jgi:hypothetical protein
MIDEETKKALKEYIFDNYTLKSTSSGKKHKVSEEKLSLKILKEKLDKYIKEEKDIFTFSTLLEYYRQEKKMSTSEVYKNVWMDRRLYSQIMGNRNYRPLRTTAILLGLSLRLNKEEMDRLLESAGFLLSTSSFIDLTVMFCMNFGIYDISDINALLMAIDQKVLCKENVE